MRTPPGYPLHYVLQHHHFLCHGCGTQTDASALLTCERAGASGKGYHYSHPEARIYNLEVVETHTHFTTPRCAKCINTLPREAVPALPPPKERLNWVRPATVETNGIKVDLSELGL